MCGIMGYAGKGSAEEVLVKGLKRLEYRGYDSAGLALFLAQEKSKVQIIKTEGKLAKLQALLEDKPHEPSHCGVGHTRWATHGKPTTQNAHPHRADHVVLVHNGIIENYLQIEEWVKEKGYTPVSETDSELFGYLVHDLMEQGKSLQEAVRLSYQRIEGNSSIVVMSEREPGKIVGARNGSPLVAAIDSEGGAYLASDAQPMLDYSQEVWFMENGDLVVAEDGKIDFFSVATGAAIKREKTTLDWSADKLDKRGYPHYMLKEIHEQPQTMVDTLNSTLDRAHTDPFPLANSVGVDHLRKARELALIASGTSWHAAFLGKYWLERWAGIPTLVELSSEFRYRDPIVTRDTAIVGISQSGETTDTLAVIQESRRRGLTTVAISNVRGSTIAREADSAFFTSAGPEIGVAATKTFTAQMMMLLLWAGYLGLQRGKDTAEKIPKLFDGVVHLPHVLEAALQDGSEFLSQCKKVADQVSDAKGFFFIGRGYSYPVALEGALKLKEIAYIHAEGYAGGELKHGPIAMIDKDMVLVAICPKDSWRKKSLSNLQEVKARGARVIGVCNPDDRELKDQCDYVIEIPGSEKFLDQMDESLYPFLTTPVMQLLSYEIAVNKGTEVDQPRNLAKSVTVE